MNPVSLRLGSELDLQAETGADRDAMGAGWGLASCRREVDICRLAVRDSRTLPGVALRLFFFDHSSHMV